MTTPSNGGRLSPEDLAALEARRGNLGRFGEAHHSDPEITLPAHTNSTPEHIPAGVGWFDDDGLLHREDGPALEANTGTASWYEHGTLRRKETHDGTTVLFDDDGLPHADDGPAIVFEDGEAQFLFHGELVSILQPDGTPLSLFDVQAAFERLAAARDAGRDVFVPAVRIELNDLIHDRYPDAARLRLRWVAGATPAGSWWEPAALERRDGQVIDTAGAGDAFRATVADLVTMLERDDVPEAVLDLDRALTRA
ncbi:hypothetical protein [Agromyces humi]|uniref:hypothetical protein n=1 Tax=Agromyces humi TaxID=1766800 RepID=UPI00135BDD0D|nr:hypothetical protein [Agromyces humi]